MKLKKAGIITKIVILVLVVYAVVTIVSLQGKASAVRAEQDALRQEIAELEINNAELEYAIENKDNDDVIAGIARDELGLIGPDEKVFYDSSN